MAVGLMVAFNDTPNPSLVRLLGSSTSGQAIDQGGMVVLFAIGLGILTEISGSLRRIASRKTEE